MKRAVYFFWLLLLIGLAPKSWAASIDTLQIEILPTSRDTLCQGDTLHLHARSNAPGIPIQWTPNNAILLNDDSLIIVAPLQSSWYFASISDDDCTAVDSVFIEVIPIGLRIDPVPDQCAGQPFFLNASADVPGEFLWIAAPPSGEELEGPEVEAFPTDTTLYTLYFTSACGVATRQFVINAAENPNAEIDCISNGFGDPVVQEGVEETLTASPNDIPGAMYNWSTGEDSDRIVILPTPPESSYSLTITYANGCTRVAEKILEVIPADVQMPNAFTPGSEGMNNIFRPVVLEGEITIDSFDIYNRWGELVFQNDNPEGWDGTFKGRPAASDVYLYKIVIRRADGSSFELQGNVTLIR